MSFQDYYRVYVWELPVRIFHWVNFLCVMALIATGLIIGNPPAIMSGAEATDQYWFGVVRFVHFATAYLFTFNLIYRVFWGFVGNKYVRWSAFWPFTKERWHNFVCTLRVDVLLRKPEQKEGHIMSVGHNQLAYMSYFVFFFLCLFQIGTGFALYADTSSWWFAGLFAWVKDVLGGDMPTRLYHHIGTWCMIIFTIVHIYLVMYHDWLEGRGIVSSMFGGYKFIRKERVEHSQ
jgi:Ni/Fe-hydrogenase 1 B-type cytochrome subunit